MDDDKWDLMALDLHKHKFEVTLKQFSGYLENYLGQALTSKEKECIWETFKVKDN